MFMSKVRQSAWFSYGLNAFFGACLTGCASVGTPGGGLYDETPPVLRSSDPADGATMVRKRKITMRFDENIKLDNALEKLTVSPPQEKSPTILSNAKTLSIELLDTLQANTTYSIDLGNAVQDNNEGNPMARLSLLFSTGPTIDSLQLSGYLLNAADLEPVSGAYVGIYNEAGNALGDSILSQRTMQRAGKTDEYGHFSILGCAPGQYRLYALVDGNSNFRYDMWSENIAFCDTLVQPSADSTQLLLMAFNEGRLNRYLEDCTRPDSIHINVRFATQMDSLPRLTWLMPDGSRLAGDSTLLVQDNLTHDTLSYWICDSALYNADTLMLEMSYLYTDTAGVDVMRTDTMQMLRPARRQQAKASDDKPDDKRQGGGLRRLRRGKKAERAKGDSVPAAPQVTYMTIKQIAGQNLGIGAKPRFEASAPLDSLHTDMIHLQYRRDTLWVDMPCEWVPDTLHPCRYTLLARPHYTPGMQYQLVVDSAAMRSIYGHPVDKTVLKFKEKTNEEYAHLLFNISGIDTTAYVELLNAKDQPVQRAQVVRGQAKFVHVVPGTYYARLVVDANGNGRHDTGSLFEHRHPEQVYYFNAQLSLRSNWTIQQNWNPTETPLLQQKPDGVKQNKPKEKTERKSRNEEYRQKMRK